MPFQPANCIKVELKWRHETTNLHWRNILHVGPQAAPITQADANSIASEIQDALVGATLWLPYLDAQVSLDGCEITWLGVEGAEQFHTVLPNTSPFTGDIPTLPLNVAFCTTIRTTLNSRNGRGRIYTSGLSSDVLDDLRVNSVDAAVADAIVSFWDAVRGQIDGGTPWQLGVLSRYDGVDPDGKPIPRAAGLFTPATQVSYTSLRLASMRSRLKSSS